MIRARVATTVALMKRVILLAELAVLLEAKLGCRLDGIYPPTADHAADTEELPA